MKRALTLVAVPLLFSCMGAWDQRGWQPPGDDPGGDDGGVGETGDGDPGGDDAAPTGGTVAPGGACECDGDCRGDASSPGLCIDGICGALASSSSCAPGSSAECPTGLRCWTLGSGLGVCYPDYVPASCAGEEDDYGSCVARADQGCFAVCGELCDLPGEPGGGPGDGDADVDADGDTDVDVDVDADADVDGDSDSDGDVDPPSDLTPEEEDLLLALNDERASYGLPPVEVDARLMCAARNHALDVGSSGACGHVGSDGSWPWDRAEACGFPQEEWTVNEIAAGPGFSDGADAVWGWRHSSGHHAAIVHTEARYVGVAVHMTCFIALFDCCVASG